MKKVTIFACAAALAAFGAACGDDDGGTVPMTDGGPQTDGNTTVTDYCPPSRNTPDPEGQSGACCARMSNADRLDAPELRFSSLVVSEPAVLGTQIILGVLQPAFDEERFNWLVQVTGADDEGALEIRTGYGERNEGGTFAFVQDIAPTDDGLPADRWNPVTLEGSLTGNTVSTMRMANAMTIPVQDANDPEKITIELPIQNVTLNNMVWDDTRTCVGERGRTTYDVTQAELEAYMTVEDAASGGIELSGVVKTLCAIIAAPIDENTEAGDIDECLGDDATPVAQWTNKPNALCENGTCTKNTDGMTDVCDPETTCNAWKLLAGFAAQGIEITN